MLAKRELEKFDFTVLNSGTCYMCEQDALALCRSSNPRWFLRGKLRENKLQEWDDWLDEHPIETVPCLMITIPIVLDFESRPYRLLCARHLGWLTELIAAEPPAPAPDPLIKRRWQQKVDESFENLTLRELLVATMQAAEACGQDMVTHDSKCFYYRKAALKKLNYWLVQNKFTDQPITEEDLA